MKKPIQLFLILAALALVSIAVASLYLYPYNPLRPPLANETNHTRSGVEAVVSSANNMAVNLYKEIARREPGNIFYAPFSVYSALAVTYEGARGLTAEEFRSALGYPDPSILRPNYAYLYNSLNRAEGVELGIGNALWVQAGFDVLPEFARVASDFYGARAANLDFIRDPEGSRQAINRFIEEQTRGKIKDLIPPGSINPLVRLVITNAVYFKGSWLYRFEVTMTRKAPFKTADGQTVQVDMMCMEPQEKDFMYANLSDVEVLELPYAGGRFSMVILLPKGRLEAFESQLTPELLSRILSSTKPERLDEICIPKFELNTKYQLNQPLEDLGLKTPFTPEADFSGIDGRRDLYISLVIHQAYVKVDEEGTEAAGATAVVIKVTAIQPNRKTFIADHPFIFLIRDNQTGLVLFMGRLANPTSG